MDPVPRAWGLALLLASLAAPGCGPSAGVDPARLAEARASWLLSEEPAGSTTPLELRAGGAELPTTPVALVGRVGGMPNPWPETETDFPWRANQATLFLVDPTTAEEFAAHAAEVGPDHKDCPFCARRVTETVDGVACVTFPDASGKPAPIGARELFDLNEGDLVVVRGRATLVAGNLLVVEADGLYRRE